jgi:hypothetical protein
MFRIFEELTLNAVARSTAVYMFEEKKLFGQ